MGHQLENFDEDETHILIIALSNLLRELKETFSDHRFPDCSFIEEQIEQVDNLLWKVRNKAE